MSHEVETMAYAGKTPWHGLGVYLGEDNVDGQRMQTAAGLDWTVEKGILYQEDSREFAPVPDVYCMIRSDTGKALPGVSVGSVYTPFQNRDLFAFGDALRQADRCVKWHTAGSLKEGRKIWAMAELEGAAFEIRRRDGSIDKSCPYLLLYNSHDGTSRITVAFVRVRVVCWNTLQASMGSKGETYRVRHTVNAPDRLADAAQALGFAVEAFTEQQQAMQDLANAPFQRADFVGLACQLLTGEDDLEKAKELVAKSQDRSRSMYTRKGGELVTLFEHGTGNAGADKYDALNAITEWVDHQRGRIQDWRKQADRLRADEKALDSALWGSGAKLKRKALQLLTR
jgi:phage/plasmid-like protein (TIGR03299 family)